MTQQSAKGKSQALSSRDLVMVCAKAAIDKKANHSIIFEVGKLGAFTDYFLITGATSERQVQAIADEVIRQGKLAGGGSARMEGYEEGRWTLIDFGNVVVHVFHDYIREFYNLETLWGEAPRVIIPEEFYRSPPSSL